MNLTDRTSYPFSRLPHCELIRWNQNKILILWQSLNILIPFVQEIE